MFLTVEDTDEQVGGWRSIKSTVVKKMRVFVIQEIFIYRVWAVVKAMPSLRVLRNTPGVSNVERARCDTGCSCSL